MNNGILNNVASEYYRSINCHTDIKHTENTHELFKSQGTIWQEVSRSS
jgi:hypothetical protein